MKNMNTEYSSTERTPAVLPEYESLLPPLTQEQYKALERDILANGCYAPIIVNADMVVIDGHNRKAICEKHDIPYRIAVFSFEDALEAKRWMLETQRGRRNIGVWELGKIALKLRPEIEAKARANQSAYYGNQFEAGLMTTMSEILSPVLTRKELADSVGIGEVTMGKVMKIDDNAPEAIRKELDSGSLSVDRAYRLTRQIMDLPEEEREQAAEIGLELERARREIREKDAEADRQTKIAKQFSKAFEHAVLLDVTEENIRIWTRCARMRPEEIEDNAKEADELAQNFLEIARLLRAHLQREAA